VTIAKVKQGGNITSGTIISQEKFTKKLLTTDVSIENGLKKCEAMPSIHFCGKSVSRMQIIPWKQRRDFATEIRLERLVCC
jgi:hypothetical protein